MVNMGPWMHRTSQHPETMKLVSRYQDYWKWADRSGYTNWCLLWALRMVLDARPELQWPPDRVRWHGSVGTLATRLKADRPQELVPVGEARVGDLVLHLGNPNHAGIVVFTGAKLGTIEANVGQRVDIRVRPHKHWALAWRWWAEEEE